MYCLTGNSKCEEEEPQRSQNISGSDALLGRWDNSRNFLLRSDVEDSGLTSLLHEVFVKKKKALKN